MLPTLSIVLFSQVKTATFPPPSWLPLPSRIPKSDALKAKNRLLGTNSSQATLMNSPNIHRNFSTDLRHVVSCIISKEDTSLCSKPYSLWNISVTYLPGNSALSTSSAHLPWVLQQQKLPRISAASKSFLHTTPHTHTAS